MKNPFRYFKTSPEIIRLAVMMYIRFPLSLRNVEDLIHERGIDVSYETVRYWWNRFGPVFAAQIRKRLANQYGSHWQWHVDEMFVKIRGETYYLWRAVDHEGEVLDVCVTKSRDRYAALRFFRRVLKHRETPHTVITDQLRSYAAAFRLAGMDSQHLTGRYLNNRIENSHQPMRRREQAMQRFRGMPTLRKFVTIHTSLYNHFNLERHIYSRQVFKRRRSRALTEWRQLCSG